MKLKVGLKLHSQLINSWSPQLGLPLGIYEVYHICADYFTVIQPGGVPFPVGRRYFEEYVNAQLKKGDELYFGMDFGKSGSDHTAIITAERINGNLHIKEQIRQVGNYAEQIKTKNKDGKIIIVPRKVTTIKRGKGFTGRAITSGTRPVTIAVGHISH